MAPAFGQAGGGNQYRFLDADGTLLSQSELVERGIIGNPYRFDAGDPATGAALTHGAQAADRSGRRAPQRRSQPVNELDEVAEELLARGLGEGVDFFVSGRSPVDLSSEYVGLRRLDDGGYEVWYRGDWGTDRTLVETPDFAAARECFVTEAVTLAEGRWGRSARG